jgi:HK97 family phage prohead protease
MWIVNVFKSIVDVVVSAHVYVEKGVVVEHLVEDKPKQFDIMDEGERLISGYCSVEIVDKQGDIIPISELKKAMFAYMKRGGHIMYGHTNKPVGRVLQWEVEKHDAGVYGIKIVAEIFKDYEVDNAVWEAIKEGKLKGFSVGAQAKSDKAYVKDANGTKKEVRVLKDLNLMEISIVAEPANPLALIDEVNYYAKGKSVEIKKKKFEEIVKISDVRILGSNNDYSDVENILKDMGYEEDEINELINVVKYHEFRRRMKRNVERLKEIVVNVRKDVDGAIVEVMKPFGAWESFDDCVADMKRKGYGEESAKRICGALKRDLEEKFKL